MLLTELYDSDYLSYNESNAILLDFFFILFTRKINNDEKSDKMYKVMEK